MGIFTKEQWQEQPQIFKPSGEDDEVVVQVFITSRSKSSSKNCPLAGEDEDSDDVDVDLAVVGLLENHGHRRRIRFKPSAARPVLHFRQSKTSFSCPFATSLNTGDSVERGVDRNG